METLKRSLTQRTTQITVFEGDGTRNQSAAVAWLIYVKVEGAGLGAEVSRLSSFFLNP